MSKLIFQVSGPINSPLVIYLPGIHGDWTPLEAARDALTDHVRLVEVEYPKEPDWDMARYAHSVKELLDAFGVEKAHFVAESFGSLVAWEFALQEMHRVQSLILVGGFTSTPGALKTLAAKAGLNLVPTGLFETAVEWYSRSKGRRKTLFHEHEGVQPYSSLQTPKGLKGLVNRLAHVHKANYIPQLDTMQFPVRYIGGDRDPIIPVAGEISILHKSLPQESAFESHLIPGAGHMIIASHPDETTSAICDWIREISTGSESSPK
jgi:pimeloyl-ACP methyl ester carboxylesterase